MSKALVILGVFLFSATILRANTDSTGVKYVNGKLFIIHKVDKGQGLYAIARRYNTSVDKIKAANKDLGASLTIGQTVLVPCDKKGAAPKAGNDKQSEKTKKTTSELKPKKTATKPEKEPDDNAGADDREPIYHKVTKNETLYQIAVNHKMSVEELKAMNKGLKSLKIGQKIVVGYKDEAEKPKKTTATKNEKGAKGQKTASKGSKGSKTAKKDNTEKKVINESGMATWVDDGSIKGEMSLALHKTAPEGTLIKVTNPMNGKYKYVKVIGNLPDNDENKNLLIKIAKSTADELDIRDKQFRLDLSYSEEVEK